MCFIFLIVSGYSDGGISIKIVEYAELKGVMPFRFQFRPVFAVGCESCIDFELVAQFHLLPWTKRFSIDQDAVLFR